MSPFCFPPCRSTVAPLAEQLRMPALNEHLQWPQLSESHRAAFKENPAAKVLLARGTKLFKLTQHAWRDDCISPWWSYCTNQAGEYGGLRNALSGAAVHPDVARIGTVVRTDWNALSNVQRIEVIAREGVFAWVGTAHGGAQQIYLPELTIVHVKLLDICNVSQAVA